MGKSTINGHFQQQTVSLLEGICNLHHIPSYLIISSDPHFDDFPKGLNLDFNDLDQQLPMTFPCHFPRDLPTKNDALDTTHLWENWGWFKSLLLPYYNQSTIV